MKLLLALAAPLAALALLIDSPADLPAGGSFELTWTEDPVTAVFYFTEDGEPPLYPLAVSSTFTNRTTARMPKTTADGGYIIAFGADGKGPIGRTGRISVAQP